MLTVSSIGIRTTNTKRGSSGQRMPRQHQDAPAPEGQGDQWVHYCRDICGDQADEETTDDVDRAMVRRSPASTCFAWAGGCRGVQSWSIPCQPVRVERVQSRGASVHEPSARSTSAVGYGVTVFPETTSPVLWPW